MGAGALSLESDGSGWVLFAISFGSSSIKTRYIKSVFNSYLLGMLLLRLLEGVKNTADEGS